MDVTTLRLATIQLTEALLEQYLTYERVLVTELSRTQGHADWEGRFAFAHQHALHQAGLDTHTYERTRALVGDWCSRRAGLELVQSRVASARETVRANRGDEVLRARQVLERAEKELPELERLDELEARYGQEAVALLAKRGAEVLESHREVARLEGCHHLDGAGGPRGH